MSGSGPLGPLVILVTIRFLYISIKGNRIYCLSNSMLKRGGGGILPQRKAYHLLQHVINLHFS